MNDTLITVQNLSKRYLSFANPASKILYALFPKFIAGGKEIWALKNINFEIKRGEAVAIIGRNGGGKSTLLELIAGTLSPTSGSVSLNGSLSALLELGSGFDPDYTGRENVILNGLLLGLSRAEILKRFNEIETFADIGSALDRPVKTYSTGMMMRLAFAVQVICNPEILIIDEALGVGDFFFQQKCFSLIRELNKKGTTLLYVSHDMGTVRELCSRVIYLKQGNLVFDGPPVKGIRLYFNETSALNLHSYDGLPVKETSAYSNDIPMDDAIWSAETLSYGKLKTIALYGIDGIPRANFRLGETMIMRIKFLPDPRVVNHVGIVIYDKFGAIRTTTGSKFLDVTVDEDLEGYRVFELRINLMLEAGQYSLKANLSYATGMNTGHPLDETDMIGPITITWDYERETAPFLGQVGLPVTAKYL